MKKITVIVLTYNHGKFVEKALESILEQKTKYDYEILIGDDCSPDDTALKLKEYKQKYSDKINLILRNKNIGVRNNFLDLLSKAKGEYIALLEGDDYWEDEDKLEKMVSFLENNKEYIGGFHNIHVIDGNSNYKINHEYHESELFTDINSLEEHYDGKVMMTLSMVFKNIFKDKKNLKEYEELIFGVKYVCDYSLKSLLLKFGKFKYFSNIYGAYRHIDDSGTSWSAQAQIVKQKDFFIIYKNQIEKFGEITEKYFSLSYLILFLRIILFNLKQKNVKELCSNIKEFKYSIFLKRSIYKLILKRIKNGK